VNPEPQNEHAIRLGIRKDSSGRVVIEGEADFLREDPFAPLTRPGTPLKAGIEAAFQALGNAPGGSVVTKGLRRYAGSLKERFEVLEGESWPVAEVIEAELERLSRSPRASVRFQALLETIDRNVPDYFSDLKKVGLYPFLLSAFDKTRLAVPLQLVEPGSSGEQIIGDSDAVLHTHRDGRKEILLRSPGPDVITTWRALACTGVLPDKVRAIHHEVLHSHQRAPEDRLRDLRRELGILRGVSLSSLGLYLANFALHLTNMMPDKPFFYIMAITLAGVAGTALWRTGLNRRLRKLGEAPPTSTLAEVHAFHDSKADFREGSFSLTPALDVAENLAHSACYGPDAATLTRGQNIEVAIRSSGEDRGLCSAPGELLALPLTLLPLMGDAAARMATMRTSFHAYNALHTLTLLDRAGREYAGEPDGLPSLCWLAEKVNEATLGADGRYEELEKAVRERRKRLGLIDDKEWQAVLPALHGRYLLESLLTQKQVREIAQAALGDGQA